MKILLIIAFVSISLCESFGQQSGKEFLGKVSYITSQNIYIRLNKSYNIQVGDTIFIRKGNEMIPLFIVESRSSLSCMGKPLNGIEISVGDEVLGRSVITTEEIKEKLISKTQNEIMVENQPEIKNEDQPFKQKTKGRISVSSYSNLSKATKSDYHRLRYTLSSQVNNIANGRFSSDAYLSFVHKIGDWPEVQDNIFNALKIYNLALKYQPGQNSSIWAGRKINPNLSNIGAIDGVQQETNIRNFRFGTVLGFRPDYSDYSLNTNLLEYGAFVAHEYKNDTGYMQISLAFFEQKNKGNTDRRFVYFQHSNSLLKNLYFFVSSELDLYKIDNGSAKNTLSLTSLYLSLRYRVIRQLSLYVSYDARKNIIYFETFKSIIDQLLEEATRQGLQFHINYRPTNIISLGLNTSYRVRDNDSRPAKTLNSFVSFTQIPILNASITLSSNLLQTSYLEGKIIGMQFNKDFFDGKLYYSMSYRFVNYKFYCTCSSLLQHIGELDLTYRINKKISLSVNYETTIEKSTNFNRLYFSLIKRF